MLNVNGAVCIYVEKGDGDWRGGGSCMYNMYIFDVFCNFFFTLFLFCVLLCVALCLCL